VNDLERAREQREMGKVYCWLLVGWYVILVGLFYFHHLVQP
jgi:hypothetical protein